jgi:hypothetical protein
MMITGRRSRSVFERYNIINETDLLKAAELMNGTLSTQLADYGSESKPKKVHKIIDFK